MIEAIPEGRIWENSSQSFSWKPSMKSRGGKWREREKMENFWLGSPKRTSLEMEGQDIYSQELPLCNPFSRQLISLFTLDRHSDTFASLDIGLVLYHLRHLLCSYVPAQAVAVGILQLENCAFFPVRLLWKVLLTKVGLLPAWAVSGIRGAMARVRSHVSL